MPQAYVSFFSGTLLTIAKQALATVLTEGSRAVDCTVGNGHDTLFLARSVGENGRVFGFDIQAQALESARRRLAEAGVGQHVTLFEAGHERLAELLPPEAEGSLACAMFNLGYLPGGDKTVVTKIPTTLTALDTTLAWLKPGGILSVHCYGGHPGGLDELSAVRGWAQALAWPGWRVLVVDQPNKDVNPEVLVLVEKNG